MFNTLFPPKDKIWSFVFHIRIYSPAKNILLKKTLKWDFTDCDFLQLNASQKAEVSHRRQETSWSKLYWRATHIHNFTTLIMIVPLCIRWELARVNICVLPQLIELSEIPEITLSHN